MALVKYLPIFKMAAIVNLYRQMSGYRRKLIRWSWPRQWLDTDGDKHKCGIWCTWYK